MFDGCDRYLSVVVERSFHILDTHQVNKWLFQYTDARNHSTNCDMRKPINDYQTGNVQDSALQIDDAYGIMYFLRMLSIKSRASTKSFAPLFNFNTELSFA